MKQFIILLFALIDGAMAQQILPLTTDKTTSLIFPFAIKHVDRGTKDILVQPVKEDEKVLLVKAAARQFSETNLSVVTADGTVYTFTVCYEEKPVKFQFHLPPSEKATVASYANSILNNKGKRLIRSEHYGVSVQLAGIYVRDNVMYYQLLIKNRGPLDFDIDLLQFTINDRISARRTARQEKVLVPLYIAGKKDKVEAYRFTVLVVALDKFTIPDAKFLTIRILEKNGGRHFNLKISNHLLMKAVLLPALN
ncbi:MAG: conjugative transposon protein TraN [Sphingobacteriales bacterium]|nr:conjugative transposon protein TraN [Sphingobacteriales bacterium]